MDKEPMNNWVLEVERLQERMGKVEQTLSDNNLKPKPATATATETETHTQ
jgi:hypothetical protein